MGVKYFGESDALLIIQLIHSELAKYVKAIEGKGLSDENFTSELKNKLDDINLEDYATLVSPAFSGNPTTPTPDVGDNTTKIANTAFVTAAIANALAKITGIKFQKVDSFENLPATGEIGVIYLVPNSGTAPNVSDEYFWDGEKYEIFGTTQVDLTGYLKESDLVEMSAEDVQAAWDSVFNV